MNFNYELEIPANTSESSPEKLMMNLTFGILTKCYIIIPTGHAGLAHLKIMYHESQLYPLPPSTEYHGDGNEISFEDRQPIFINPYELKAIGWNTDDTYPHSFLMNFTITLPETLGIPAVAPDVLEIVRNIIGAELIIPPAIPPTIPLVPPLKQGLVIMSKPTYANIFINDIDIDKLTKETVDLPVGDYTVRLELTDYEPWERLVSVKEGEFKEIRAELVRVPVVLPPPVLPPAVQGVYLTSSPSKAMIYIDDVDTLKLTSERLTLDVGDYKVRVEKEGYEDWEEDVPVVEGEFREVHAKMTKDPAFIPPAARQGLIIMSTPSYAHILINDIDTGKLTKEKLPFPVGEYIIKLVKEDYEDWFGEVKVLPDVFTEVHTYLTRVGEAPPEIPPYEPPEIPPEEAPAPTFPNWYSIGCSEHRAELDWFTSANYYFHHFNVYDKDELIASTTESEFIDTDVELGFSKQYYVSEVDVWGRESGKGNLHVCTHKKYTIPEVPFGKSWLIIHGSPPESAVKVSGIAVWWYSRLEPEALYIPVDPLTSYTVTIGKHLFEEYETVVESAPAGGSVHVYFDLAKTAGII